MFSFGSDSNSFKNEALNLKHMVRIILFNGNFVLSDIIKKLLKNWIVRMLY